MNKKEGYKLDTGKIRPDLIVPEFIEGIAKVLTDALSKYPIDNWKKVEDLRPRYIAALYRHLLAFHKGEILDKESGLNHNLHIGCNAMFLFWLDGVKLNADK